MTAAPAQVAGNPAPERGAACPPDVKGEPPTVGGGSSQPLSDKLAQSKGVICPPSGVDPRYTSRRPTAGLKVIPPPGTPAAIQACSRSKHRAPTLRRASSPDHRPALPSQPPRRVVGAVTRTANRHASQNIRK